MQRVREYSRHLTNSTPTSVARYNRLVCVEQRTTKPHTPPDRPPPGFQVERHATMRRLASVVLTFAAGFLVSFNVVRNLYTVQQHSDRAVRDGVRDEPLISHHSYRGAVVHLTDDTDAAAATTNRPLPRQAAHTDAQERIVRTRPPVSIWSAAPASRTHDVRHRAPADQARSEGRFERNNLATSPSVRSSARLTLCPLWPHARRAHRRCPRRPHRPALRTRGRTPPSTPATQKPTPSTGAIW